MTLSRAALCKRAAKLELKESEDITANPAFVSALENLLLDVYAFLRPRELDYEQRRLLVQIFNVMARDIFGNSGGFPVVEAFGSFTMDLSTATSDLDLSVNFSNKLVDYSREKKISALRKFARVLYTHQARGLVSGIVPVMGARVPVLKVVDNGTGIECDISVENKDGISRSRIFAIISSIDERFQILGYLMKFWAKAHKINSSKDRTLSSLSIVSLVAFHLQTRDPPILPPFSMLLKDGTDASSVQNIALGFKNFGRRNKECVAELFVTLLSKLLSVESLWKHGLCASMYDGAWISKTWGSGIGNISVEDFLDRSQNFARSVGKVETEKIYKCIRGSLTHLSRFMKGYIEASKLKRLVFGSNSVHVSSVQLVKNQEMSLKRSFPLHDSAASLIEQIPLKRMRYTEGTDELYHPCLETSAFTSSADLFIPLHPPVLPSQVSYGVCHQESLAIPQSVSWYHRQPPIALDVGYKSEEQTKYPFACPQTLDGSQQYPQLSFAPQLAYELERQPPLPHPTLLPYGLQHHHHDQSLILSRAWDDGLRNIQSDHYNQGMDHAHHPNVLPPLAYVPNYL